MSGKLTARAVPSLGLNFVFLQECQISLGKDTGALVPDREKFKATAEKFSGPFIQKRLYMPVADTAMALQVSRPHTKHVDAGVDGWGAIQADDSFPPTPTDDGT